LGAIWRFRFSRGGSGIRHHGFQYRAAGQERECHTSVPNAGDRTLRPEYPSRGQLSIVKVKTDRPHAQKSTAYSTYHSLQITGQVQEENEV